jgi:hypothetical protein
VEVTPLTTELTLFSFPDLRVLARRVLSGKDDYSAPNITFSPCGRWLSVIHRGPDGIELCDAKNIAPVDRHILTNLQRQFFAPMGGLVSLCRVPRTIICRIDALAGV